jgi:hypothetical protein
MITLSLMKPRFKPTRPSQRPEIAQVVSLERALFEIDQCYRPTSQTIELLYHRYNPPAPGKKVDGRRRVPTSFRYGLLALLAMFKVNEQMEFRQGEFRGVMRRIQKGEFARLVWTMSKGTVSWSMSMQKTLFKLLHQGKLVGKSNHYHPRGHYTELWVGLDAQKLLADIKEVTKTPAKKMPVLCRVAEDIEAACRRAINRPIDPKKGSPSLGRSGSPSLDQKKSTPSATLPGVESFSLVETESTRDREAVVPGDMEPVLKKLKEVFCDEEITEIHVAGLKRAWRHRQAKCRLTQERFDQWLALREAELDDPAIACTLDQFCSRWSWVWRSVRSIQLLATDPGSEFVDLKKCAANLEHHAMRHCLTRLNVWDHPENLVTPCDIFDRDPVQVLCRFIIASQLEFPLHWMNAFVEPVTKLVRAEPQYFVALADAGYPLQEWLGFNDAVVRELRQKALKAYGQEIRERALVQAWAI